MKLLVTSKTQEIVYVALEKVIYSIQLSSSESIPASSNLQEYKLPTEVPSNTSNGSNNNAAATAVILAIELDATEEFLIAIWSNKTISCWNVKDGILRGRKQMKKKAGTLVTATWKENHRVALVGDRGGDIWGFNLPELTKEVLLGGHTSSVITDTAYSTENNLVITVDRDEKIRYSSFPDLEVISGYSLGHTGVVSSISTINHQYLVSVGWDHKLFLWNLHSFGKVDAQVLRSIATLTKNDAEQQEGDGEESEEDGDGNEPQQTEMEIEGKEEIITKGADEEQAAVGDNADGDGDADVDGEGEKEKNYDESSFGNYPFKVASMANNVTGSFSTAVIFKDELSFQVLHYSPTAVLLSTQDINLPAVPIDILSFQLNSHWYWLVVLPLPFLFEVYAQQDNHHHHPMERVTEQFFPAELIQSLSSSLSKLFYLPVPSHIDLFSSSAIATEFQQSHFITLLGYNNETGMRKHSLENYYAQDERNPAGSRRSKKKMWKRHYFRSLHFGNK